MHKLILSYIKLSFSWWYPWEIFASFSQFSHTFSFFPNSEVPMRVSCAQQTTLNELEEVLDEFKYKNEKIIRYQNEHSDRMVFFTDFNINPILLLSKKFTHAPLKKNHNLILVFTPSHWFTHHWIDQDVILVSGPFINQNILWLVNTSL